MREGTAEYGQQRIERERNSIFRAFWVSWTDWHLKVCAFLRRLSVVIALKKGRQRIISADRWPCAESHLSCRSSERSVACVPSFVDARYCCLYTLVQSTDLQYNILLQVTFQTISDSFPFIQSYEKCLTIILNYALNDR
jgi:hypothetical protein